MPTVTIEGPVTLQETAMALQRKLGNRYEVTTQGSGSDGALKVKQSAAATATVHLSRDGTATKFQVHGGGLVISRLVNEFGIAKKVAATIQEAFATPPSADTSPDTSPDISADPPADPPADTATN